MDVGAGKGDDLLNIQKCFLGTSIVRKSVKFCAIENYDPNCQILIREGIEVYKKDLERDRLPFDDHTVDVIICNQVLEHMKEIFWIFSEFSRVLKVNGHLIIGVPNLAALHARIFLLFGQQPPCIETLGAHVRGYTKKGLINFISVGDYFEVENFAGSQFYPIPVRKINSFFAKLLPNLCAGIFLCVRRTEKTGNFIEILNDMFLETPYYKGEGRLL